MIWSIRYHGLKKARGSIASLWKKRQNKEDICWLCTFQETSTTVLQIASGIFPYSTAVFIIGHALAAWSSGSTSTMSVGCANAVEQNGVVFTSQWQNGSCISWNPPCSLKPAKRKSSMKPSRPTRKIMKLQRLLLAQVCHRPIHRQVLCWKKWYVINETQKGFLPPFLLKYLLIRPHFLTTRFRVKRCVTSVAPHSKILVKLPTGGWSLDWQRSLQVISFLKYIVYYKVRK